MTLAEFTLAIATALAPERDNSELTNAVAETVEARGCLYRGDDCERRTAAVMITWAWFESGLRIDAHGKNHDEGAWQHVTTNADEAKRLRSDVRYAASVAWDDMRASLTACGDLSAYARGNCTAGRAIVARRMPKVSWAFRKAAH